MSFNNNKTVLRETSPSHEYDDVPAYPRYSTIKDKSVENAAPYDETPYDENDMPHSPHIHYNNDETYKDVDAGKHVAQTAPVALRHRNDARSIMRAFTMMCSVGIFCALITQWGMQFENSGRWTTVVTSNSWLTLPVVFGIFCWEFADLITYWARGRGITPAAHIALQLIGALCAGVAFVFAMLSILYWSLPARENTADRLNQLVPEVLDCALVLCIMISCWTRFGLAIRDHRARKAAARLAKYNARETV